MGSLTRIWLKEDIDGMIRMDDKDIKTGMNSFGMDEFPYGNGWLDE